MSTLRCGFLVSGRGSNLQAIIDQVQSGALDVELAVVISDIADAAALDRARDVGIPAVHIAPDSSKTKMETSMVRCLREHHVDLVCLAGYMRIVKAPLLQAYPQRIINIHPSLLPAFPGLQAPKKALDYGVKLSGCTVHFVDEGTDTGPIICQAVVLVHDEDTPESLSARILKEEHRIYSDAIRWIANDELRIEGRRVFRINH